MALVVFLRGVNVGGHRTFRPSVLAKELRAYGVVNIGAAGTFVVRNPGSRAKFLAALRRRLPFETEIMICEGRDVLRIEKDNPFGTKTSAQVVRFVSVLSKAGGAPPKAVKLPREGAWLVRIVGTKSQFVFGEYRRHMKTIGYLGQLDKLCGAPVTTRNWNTMNAIARILRSDKHHKGDPMRKAQTGLFAALVAIVIAIPASAQSDVRELPADQQIMQALNRLTFGARPGDIQKVRATGLDNWMDQQLHPNRIDNSAMDAFMTKYTVLAQNQNDLLKQYAEMQQARRTQKRDPQSELAMAKTRADSAAIRQQPQRQFGGIVQLGAQLQSERIARAVGSERQLEEVMTDFWLNHFNVYIRKGGPEVYYLADYEENVIRPNSLGKFRNLLEAVAKSPAMLFYLDNARSVADSTHATLSSLQGRGRAANIARLKQLASSGRLNDQQQQRLQQLMQQMPQGLNENYGRELLELHTLGVDGGYTQQDVINVARAFTGWTIKQPAQRGGFIFRPEVHDADEKIVLGHTLPAGRGMEDAEDVLTIVSRSPATAKFIATKLARRFVSDNPPPALVNRAAVTFLKTDGDIRETLRTIITSPEFFAQSTFRSKVKSPFEVVASAMRAMNAQPDSTARTALVVAYLGQPIYGHQAPNGWPETGESWMNTGAILNRINFGMAVAAGRLPGVDISAIPALDTLRSASRVKQVDAVVATILTGIASPDTRKVLESGENPLLATATPDDITRAAGISADDPGAMTASDDNPQLMQQMTPQQRRDARRNANVKNGGRQMLNGRGLGAIPQLSGLAQIVGLALGSPEFQRR